jgi:peptidoglycan/xylan/chitin deacetylase (PgdA/CDA1 family)
MTRTHAGSWKWRDPEDRALVLMYHRIADLTTDPWSLSVSPDHFNEHLQVVKRIGRAVKTPELVTHRRASGDVPLLALTFDDGYGDNFLCAKPLLERWDVPATFYLATGVLGADREFWWDDLDRLFLQPGVLPARLDLEIEGAAWTWTLGAGAAYDTAAFDRHRSWKADDQPPTSRQEIYRSVWQLMQPLPATSQKAILESLLSWASASREGRPANRPMTPDAAAEIAASALFELGAHTVTHPLLSSLTAGVQRREIECSKQHVEAIAGRPVSTFTYPYGDCDAAIVAVVAQAGFTSACTTAPNAVHADGDLLRLPRIHVGNWTGDEFERRLSEWLTR